MYYKNWYLKYFHMFQYLFYLVMIVDKNLSLNHHLNIQNQNALIYLSYLEALPKNGLRPFFYEFVLTINSLKIMVTRNISAKERVKILLKYY